MSEPNQIGIQIAGHFEPGKLERQDVPLYPPLALREALVNAICHRDYTIAGGAIFVAIYDDRLEVTSLGLLPPGITVAELKQNHASRLRNPLIAGVFYRRGLIEQWGRGTQKIVSWCVAAGQPEPEFEEQAGAVVVRFRPSGYHPPLRVGHDLSRPPAESSLDFERRGAMDGQGHPRPVGASTRETDLAG
jgi:ATP-dependent DNA helicase RecG